MEYRDPSKRGRWIVIIGVVLALAAGGAAFYLISQAQQKAGQGDLVKVNVVVAARPIPVRQPIVAEDVIVREVPADDTNTDAIAVRDPNEVIGQVMPITLFQGQMITRSMLNAAGGGAAGGAGGFSILDPGETVAPDSEAWRAVAMTVPDDRAVGGLITAGMSVDVLVSAQVNVPQDLMAEGKYYTDKSTKITYQNMLVLAKTGSGYVVKATLAQAEEITHLVATGNAQFSMLMRPASDVRYADASKLGETTNLILQRYGLPIPQNYPAGNGPIATLAPTAPPSQPVSPSGTPASAAP
ncbi:MAG TPA: SAF domain-containing protein [Candidatus Limnocylindrales bacterium]|jgi:Flp pilus assembly protein CpaB|nr:SAF domain-containing protein [Candidatus Limnocylindrales bacterium]